MNARERLLTSLSHREDEFPVDFGSTAVSGMHISVIAELRQYYELDNRPVKLIEPYQMLGEVDDELKNIIGIDTEAVLAPATLFGFANSNWKPWRTPWQQDILVPAQFNIKVDNGNLLIFPEGDMTVPPSGKMPQGGYFFDSIIRQQPIIEGKLNPEDNLEEFAPISKENLEYYRDAGSKARATGRAVVAALPGAGLGDIALVPGPFMKNPKGIRDVAEWYISTVARQDYLHAVFEKQTDIAVANMEKIAAVAGDAIDVVFICGTDFGTQTSSFCSPDSFRSLYMPYYQKINNWIHLNTKWKTFKHSCGAVEKFIPLFIEAGFDILNPVQISASGMDPVNLKERYGRDITFWGGGVDTQKTLPFGTADQVREEVKTRCEILAKGGGFVFNAVHNIQSKTPVGNIAAMIDTLQKLRDA